MKKRLVIIGALLLMILGVGFLISSIPMIELENDVKIEINTEIDPYSYIKDYKKCEKEDVNVDTSNVDIHKLGEYKITYTVKDEVYEVNLKVEDTIAPTFEITDKNFFVGDEVKVEQLVDKVEDATETKISFKDEYDFSKEGTHDVSVVVEDEAGNKTEKECVVKIVKDTEKPTLTGVSNKTVYLNDKVDYLKGITAKDNRDKEPKVTVDSSEVDTSKKGSYKVKYTVEDQAGNKNEYTVTYTVTEKKSATSIPASGDKIVYLTFDDGPSSNTLKILDVLDKYNAKATFFVTGNNGGSANYRHLIKEAHDRGHTIALHTYSHNFSIYKSVDSYFADLNKVGNMVEGIIGHFPKYIRFPGGSSNTTSKKYCKGIMSTLVVEVQNRGFQYYDWNADSGDASGNNVPVSTLVKNATGFNMKNINLLMHDTQAKGTTVQALPQIIEHYRAKGYVFKGIDDNSFTPHHGVNN